MSVIRALEGADLPAVAGMFRRVLRKERTEAPAALIDYMRRFYLEAPGCGGDLRSLVHVNDAGRVSGFVGVHVLPMQFNGRQLRAAICSSLMVEDHERDPMAGARLLKAFLDGPQDISFSETANDVSTKLWTRLRGVVLPQYSLDWVRVMRPASFVLGLSASRMKLARVLNPFAHAIDRFYCRRMKSSERRWSGVAADGAGHGAFRTSQIDGDAFARLVEPLTAQFALRPSWAEAQLDHMLTDAAQKPDFGELVYASVASPVGTNVGAFAYHARAGGVGRVLQILALPGQAGSVVDCLIDDAAVRGVSGLRGRIQPALLEAMLGRRIAFLTVASTVVHSRDPELLHVMKNSQVFLNGLAGEQWSRLIGGGFT
ncbi:hypothetical protein [Mesorhizobium sp.]|uniref:hypothetical protein n=1 Tax=Mesorhizobium sp. TaxID=1871066 RepID=UPI000FE53040|nr:hypothetical protein [Mesorhizobium sp.]RWK43925.1 MAG: hypothetical protein EOR46_03570 [Mesorhizobium sp.]RWK63659.1 MAG: hypothetical protein EOR54_30115 [Mesorhizobium sp.]RWK73528.1 MAG: hypothetical protein EOR50_23495 [Mesorhizobium sp.]RWK83747.1 MAG: hypothetical protein EOR51_05960 [Mesorhizobium sp.]RWL05953.1 MAG: hypothetical protein EOR56_28955 [Mesorhizobium sp.]